MHRPPSHEAIRGPARVRGAHQAAVDVDLRDGSAGGSRRGHPEPASGHGWRSGAWHGRTLARCDGRESLIRRDEVSGLAYTPGSECARP